MIKIFFLVLIICTAALVIVALAIHLRVRRHIEQEKLEHEERPGNGQDTGNSDSKKDSSP